MRLLRRYVKWSYLWDNFYLIEFTAGRRVGFSLAFWYDRYDANQSETPSALEVPSETQVDVGSSDQSWPETGWLEEPCTDPWQCGRSSCPVCRDEVCGAGPGCDKPMGHTGNHRWPIREVGKRIIEENREALDILESYDQEGT